MPIQLSARFFVTCCGPQPEKQGGAGTNCSHFMDASPLLISQFVHLSLVDVPLNRRHLGSGPELCLYGMPRTCACTTDSCSALEFAAGAYMYLHSANCAEQAPARCHIHLLGRAIV